KSRTFIPASLADNPYLSKTGYGATLQALPEPLRSQLLYGDFSIGQVDDQWQVIPTAWVRLAQQRWQKQKKPDLRLSAIGVDVARGGKDKTVISKRYGHWYAPLEKYAGKDTPDGQSVAELVERTREDDAPVMIDVIG